MVSPKPIPWFHAVRHIDVSMASSATVPAPAVALLLSMAFLGVTAEAYQLVALAGVTGHCTADTDDTTR
jgi:drug/metabolite transporter (DMT)-like permease